MECCTYLRNIQHLVSDGKTPYERRFGQRAVRRVTEGTSAGLDENWWADSMECCCHLRNIQDKLADGKAPYERRFGMPINGPIIPFGARVEYYLLRKTSFDASVRLKSLARYISRLCIVRGETLESRHFGCGH